MKIENLDYITTKVVTPMGVWPGEDYDGTGSCLADCPVCSCSSSIVWLGGAHAFGYRVCQVCGTVWEIVDQSVVDPPDSGSSSARRQEWVLRLARIF